MICESLVLLLSLPRTPTTFHLFRAVLALGMWCMIFGITGLFLRYFSGHSPLWRYLCDSSYFIYLAHVPVLLALQIATFYVPLPAPIIAPSNPWSTMSTAPPKNSKPATRR